jgi:hypothetical protein
VPNVPFEQLEEGLAAFSDVDGDGDQDLLLTGCLSNLTNAGGLYLNSDALVKNGRSVSFKGGTGILLNTTFKVELGALF